MVPSLQIDGFVFGWDFNVIASNVFCNLRVCLLNTKFTVFGWNWPAGLLGKS